MPPQSTTELDFDILNPVLQVSTKCKILNTIWAVHPQITPKNFSQDPTLGESYLQYYGEQCRNALHVTGLKAVLRTHQDVINIIQEVKHHNLSRAEIQGHIRAIHSDNLPDDTDSHDALLGEAINLGVRLLTMIDIGEMTHGFVPGQKSLLWDGGLLRKLVHDHFNSRSIIQERVKLDRIFNARNLERIAGLQIVWTSNLADHLRLTVDDTRIAIFHHASFLDHQKSKSFFPPGFIEETLKTLALLLPQYDQQSRKWFRNHRIKWYLDDKAATCGHLTTEERQIENFVFWHDRLVILKQVFDDAEPSTISQWWGDRRRKVQWYTFWVAALVLFLTILTIFFGVIQVIEGGLQVYKAYHPS